MSPYFGHRAAPPAIVQVTQPPPRPGHYIVLIEGLVLFEPNWWTWDGQSWDHRFITQRGDSGMPGRRLFWVVRSYQPLES